MVVLNRKNGDSVMLKKKYIVTAVGILCILLGSLFVNNVILAQSGSEYDPWLDYNDDGIIDVHDLATLSQAYGSSGEPLNIPLTLEYSSGWIDITDKQGQYFNITHNLNITTSYMPRVWGRTTSDGALHRRHFSGTGYTPGWNRTHGGTNGDEAFSLVQTSDGGYALAGWTWVSPGGIPDHLDARFVKFDSVGNLQWNHTWGGEKDDALYSVVQADDGGYALAGYTASYGDSIGGRDFWLVKTDSSGNAVWNKTYRPEGIFATERAEAVVQTSDGGYALAGYRYGIYDTGYDFMLVKTNSTGDQSWMASWGGVEDDVAYSLVQTSDGGYLLAGETFSYGTGTPSESNAWLVKFGSTGLKEWDNPYGALGTDKAFSLIQTADGNYSFTGRYESTSTNDDFWLVKIYPNGTQIWSRTYGFSAPPTYTATYEYAFSLVQTSDGGYALAGYLVAYGAGNNDLGLVKTDPAGNMIWSRTYGGDGWDVARSVVQTDDGGYALAGYAASFGAGSFDFYLVKTDPFGLMEAFEFGLAITGYTADTLELYRGAIDPYWNYVNVRIWVAK